MRVVFYSWRRQVERKILSHRRLGGLLAMLLVLLPLLLSAAACSRGAQLEQAQRSWDSGDYAAAADLYETFLREQPQSEEVPEVRYRVGTICARDLRQYERAIEHLIR
ncbi:MAG: hypothetical protein ACKOB4_04980, partial [Acidobacteriota bacterium]